MRRIIFLLFALLPGWASASGSLITHAMGQTKVPAAPQRVVVLTNEGTEAVLALGLTPVGAAQSWLGDPWYEHIASEMTDVVNVGMESAVNLELIAALEPDLILGNKQRHEAIYPQLSTIAPTVISERLRGDWRKNFVLYANALGKQEAGESLLASFQARIDTLRTQLGDATKEKVSVVRFLPTQIRIYQLDSFSGYILKLLGFARPDNQNVDDFAIRTGKESIPDMDADRLFYFTWETGDGKGLAARDEALNDPLWQTLSVVQAGNVHEVSDPVWNTAGGIIAANLMLDDIERIYSAEP